MKKLEDLRIQGASIALADEWALLDVSGDDLLSFMHAQVTADLLNLQPNNARLCSRLDRGARVQSFFYFLKTSTTNVAYLLVPKILSDVVIQDLSKFIIMEDVEIHPSQKEVFFSFGLSSLSLDGFNALFYGLPGSFHFSKSTGSQTLSLADVDGFRILSGFPRWQDGLSNEMLVNETSLNELAVDYNKGCFLGQETASKIQKNRGAATYPTLLQIDPTHSISTHKEDVLFCQGKKVATVLDHYSEDSARFILASLRREERINGAKINLETEDQQNFEATVVLLPYFKAQTFESLALELFELGGNHFRDGDEKLAESYLLKSISLDPKLEDAYESLGVIYGRQERYVEAIEKMNMLERLNPKSVMANTNKSLFYMKLGKIEEAEREKSEATIKSFQYFGDEAKRKKEAEQAEQKKIEERKTREEMFLQVLEIDELDDIALYGLAEIRFDQNLTNDAYMYLERLLENHPRHTKGHLLMGKIYIKGGKNSEAEKILRAGLDVAKKKGEMMPASEIQALLNSL